MNYEQVPPILAIRKIINRIPNKESMRVCEVGCYDAVTTCSYADIIQKHNGTIYAIDWFCGSTYLGANEYQGYNPDLANQLYQYVVKKIIQQNLQNTITIIKGDSVESAICIPDNYLDMCFIDADHTYTKTNQDIKTYLPKIKAGGILCGHDCEDINLANTFSDNELMAGHIFSRSHYANQLHAGVIQAVYDNFGYEIEQILDPKGQQRPLWLKQL